MPEVVKVKRPIVITIFAILVLLPIPVDIINLVTLNKIRYQEDIKNDETLIKNGKITYRGKTIYWEKQSDVQKNIIKRRLIRGKKIVSIYGVFKIFKSIFVVLGAFLFYGLWSLKKWTYVPLIAGFGFGILFNIILVFLNPIALLFLIAPAVASIIFGIKYYGRYFVY